VAGQQHLEDARYDRQQPIATIVGRATTDNRDALIDQPVEDWLYLLDRAMLIAGQLSGAAARHQTKMAHDAGLFLGEQVLHQRNQLVADRRSEHQGAGKASSHV
jgi:hypothetical protein